MKQKILRVMATAAALTLVGSLALFVPSAAADREDDKFVYTVNVLCQFSGGTTINIHNPGDRTVMVNKIGIPLEIGRGPTAPESKQQEVLKPDWALLMGCDDIAALGGVSPEGTGNVVIESKRELDVWAVYVSIIAGGGIGETRGPVRVPATRVGPANGPR